MKKTVPLLLLAFFTTQLSAQNFTGQWKGEFIDKSSAFVGWGGDRCEYILELECVGTKVTGYSYTYFSDGGKRYYTICKLSGTLNKGSKFIEVKETERTKTNVPINIRNCFQIHKLSYSEQGNEQSLEGTWVPVPNQEGDCGYGTTALSRRVLQKNPSYYNNNNNTTKTKPVVKPKPQQTTPPPVVQNTVPKKTNPPVAKAQPKKTTTTATAKTDTKKATPPAVVKADPKINKTENGTQPHEDKTDLAKKNLPPPVITKAEPAERKITDPGFQKRNNDLIKTIEIDNPTFTVDLYDNGEIDGDSISLFFNGKLLLSHKRLSDKAIRLKLDVDADKDLNELIMYAENLGTIPPNTALMVVNDGDNRYEVRISSDLQKSGVIRFIHKPKARQ